MHFFFSKKKKTHVSYLAEHLDSLMEEKIPQNLFPKESPIKTLKKCNKNYINK